MKTFSHASLAKMLEAKNRKISDLTKALKAETMLSDALSKLEMHPQQASCRLAAVKKAMLTKRKLNAERTCADD